MKTKGLLLLGAALLAYAVAVVWSAFRAGRFAFHDLALINDFLASAAWGRGAFRVTDLGIDHLSIHFTPTLLALVPLYRWFESQFLLLAVGACALAAGAALQTALAVRALERLGPADGPVRRIAPAAFLVLAAWGTFSKSVLFSAHFEVLYLPFASLVLWAALRGASPAWALAAALPALGVRQDAGLYLFFQAASLLLLPPALVDDRRRLRRTVALVCAASALYVALAVKVAMPLLGAPPDRYVAQWWGRYGSTWGGVAWGVLTHPWSAARDVALGGWPVLTLDLGLLPLGALPAYLVSSAPGVLLFTASAPDKAGLRFYNSAFLLPGALLCAGVGLARLARWERTARPAAALAFRAALVALPLSLLVRADHLGGGGPARWSRDPGRAAPALLRRALDACPGVGSVAADFGAVVFVPNRLPKYLLRHFDRADLVLVDEAGSLLLSDAASMDEVRRRVEASGAYALAAEDRGARAYLRRGLACR